MYQHVQIDWMKNTYKTFNYGQIYVVKFQCLRLVIFSDGYSELWKLISAHSFLLLSEDVDVHTVGNAMDHGGEGKLATCSIITLY